MKNHLTKPNADTFYKITDLEYSKLVSYETQEKAQELFQFETTKCNLHIDPFDKRQNLVIQDNVLICKK